MVTADATIQWIKEQLTNDTPLREMYLSNKSDVFVIWANALENKIEDGSLDLPVNKIGRQIRRELLDMNLESAIHRMYEVIPAKYKHAADQIQDAEEFSEMSDARTNNSSIEVNYSSQNATLIQVTKSMSDSLDTLNELLETTEIEVNCEKKYLDEVVKMSKVIKEKAKFCTDGREKVSKLDHVLTLQLANSCTLNSIYDNLTALKMSQATITSKQMGKIVGMKIKDAYVTLRPTTEQQAIQQGWSGISCEDCGEYRVVREYHSDTQDFKDHCVTCDNWQKMKLTPVITKSL